MRHSYTSSTNSLAEKELTTTKALGNVKLFCKTNARMAEYHARVHRQDKQWSGVLNKPPRLGRVFGVWVRVRERERQRQRQKQTDRVHVCKYMCVCGCNPIRQ